MKQGENKIFKVIFFNGQKDLSLLAPANGMIAVLVPSAVGDTANWHQSVGTFDKYSHICPPLNVQHCSVILSEFCASP